MFTALALMHGLVLRWSSCPWCCNGGFSVTSDCWSCGQHSWLGAVDFLKQGITDWHDNPTLFNCEPVAFTFVRILSGLQASTLHVLLPNRCWINSTRIVRAGVLFSVTVNPFVPMASCMCMHSRHPHCTVIDELQSSIFSSHRSPV